MVLFQNLPPKPPLKPPEWHFEWLEEGSGWLGVGGGGDVEVEVE